MKTHIIINNSFSYQVDLTEQLRACEIRLVSSDESLKILEEEKSLFASEAEKSRNRLAEAEKVLVTLTDMQAAAAERECVLEEVQKARDELEKSASALTTRLEQAKDTMTQQYHNSEGRLAIAAETVAALQLRVSSLELSESDLTIRSAQLEEIVASLQVRLAELQQEHKKRVEIQDSQGAVCACMWRMLVLRAVLYVGIYALRSICQT